MSMFCTGSKLQTTGKRKKAGGSCLDLFIIRLYHGSIDWLDLLLQTTSIERYKIPGAHRSNVHCFLLQLNPNAPIPFPSHRLQTVLPP